jgi:DNA-binding phage protein
MPLTLDFKETVLLRAKQDPDFRRAILKEAVACILSGDLATGKSMLRDYINATTGFAGLEGQTGIPSKSLMRMLGIRGNPSAENLSKILAALKDSEGVEFDLQLHPWKSVKANRLSRST